MGVAQLCGEGIKLKFLLVDTGSGEHPALGLGYIASSLRKEYGDEIQFKVINDDVRGSIEIFKPDIVGITAVSKNYNNAKAGAKIAKGYSLPVIIGGVHITALPGTMTNDMDIAVIGEGEETIVELLSSYMETGYFGKYIKGTAYKINGDLQITVPRELIRPLDSIAYPARDLLKVTRMAHMLSSRGCPYRCVFCATSRHTRNQVRYASAEYVAEEIEMLYKNYKIKYLTVYDDLFAVNIKRTVQIQQLLASKNLIGKFNMSINIRADLITDELVVILKEMNVDVIALGTESGCQRILNYLKCGSVTLEQNISAIRIIQKHKMIPYCSFIIGTPSETYEEMMQTIKFIEDNKLYHFDISVLTPFPGTPVWDYALKHGFVSEDMDWDKLNFYISSNPVFLSDKLTRQEVKDITVRMAKRKASYQALINRILTIKHPHRFFGGFIKARLKGLR